MKRIFLWILAVAGVAMLFVPLIAEQNSTAMFGQGSTYAEIMRNDHKQISDLIKQLATAQDMTQKKMVLNELKNGLNMHMKAEEDYLYPKLQKNPETRGIAARALDEHAAAKMQLKKLDPAQEDSVFQAHLDVLKALIDGHVDFEENMLLGKASQVLANEESMITDQFKKVYMK